MKNSFAFIIIFLGTITFLNAQLVTTGLDNGTVGTLRQQLELAVPGSTILFASTVTSISLESELVIDKDLTISGLAVGNTVVDAGANGRIFNVTNGNVVLNNLTLINGQAIDGGAIFNNAVLTLNACEINGCTANGTAGSGGAIFNNAGAVLTVNNSNLSNNTAIRAGGAIEDNSGAGLGIILNNVTMTNNYAGTSPGNGGALHITGAGDATITDCLIDTNTAAAEGGGLWNGTGIMVVMNSTINANSCIGDGADQGGGGVFNAGGTIEITGSSISNNSTIGTSTSGGGILNDLGILTVINTTISGNSTVRAGGGIEDNSVAGNTLILTNVTLDANTTGSSPGNGGGLHITGPGNSIISDCFVTNNSAVAEGGGLWNGSGFMEVSNCDISLNVATGSEADNGGGGIFNNGGTLSIMNNTRISNNTSTGTSGSGGGLLSTAGEVTIENSTFTSNSANRAGGAIELIDGNLNFNGSALIDNDVSGTVGVPAPGNGGGFHVTGNSGIIIFTNSTFTGNAAEREGGALWNQSGCEMFVESCTIDGNTSFGAEITNGGAGIFNNSGMLIITGSTVSNNIDMGSMAAGAGVHNKADGEVTIMTSTISNNTSDSGGGVYNNGTSLTINAATIAYNTARTSGGGIQSMTDTSIKNTIVANNSGTADPDVAGSNYISLGFNLIATNDADVFSGVSGDIMNVDAVLSSTLEITTGITATHSLEFGSPAYNAGDAEDTFNDQNDQPVFDGRRDIGASESQEMISSITFIDDLESNIKVFPNPIVDQFSIEIPQDFGQDITVRLYGAGSGMLLYTLETQPGVSVIKLNEFPSGFYLINTSSEKFSNTKLVNKVTR